MEVPAESAAVHSPPHRSGLRCALLWALMQATRNVHSLRAGSIQCIEYYCSDIVMGAVHSGVGSASCCRASITIPVHIHGAAALRSCNASSGEGVNIVVVKRKCKYSRPCCLQSLLYSLCLNSVVLSISYLCSVQNLQSYLRHNPFSG